MLLLTCSTVNHATKGLAERERNHVARRFSHAWIAFAEMHCSCMFRTAKKNFLICVEILW